MDLTSGPFCYIAYVAESFEKTEKDLENLENTLRNLHKEIEIYFSKNKAGATSSKVVTTFERLRSSRVRCSNMRAKSSHGAVISKSGLRKKIRRKPNSLRKSYNSSTKDYPHWFVRVIEFYMSISKAFAEVRKYLKKACRKYAAAMVTFIRVYKESAETTPEVVEKEIDMAIQGLQENYDKRLKGMNNMIRLCEHQKSAMLENRTKIQSEVEITTLEILCIKETTSKILPTVSVQEEQLKVATEKAVECEKQLHEVMILHNMLTSAKKKLNQETNKSADSREAFLEELRKRKEELMNSISVAEMEIKEKRLKLMREKENIEILASTTRYLNNKINSVRNRKRDVETEHRRTLEAIVESEKSLEEVAEKERKSVFLYQTVCVTSHKHRTDLKNMLAKNIRKLQNILLMYSLKKNMILTPIENEISIFKDNVDNAMKKLDLLDCTYVHLCARATSVEQKLIKLNYVINNVQRRFEEIDISLFMLENGYQTINKDNVLEEHTHQRNVEEELNELFEESEEETISESVDELDRLKHYIDKSHKTLSTLRQKECALGNKIRIKRHKKESIKSNFIKFSYIFLSITDLPVPSSFTSRFSPVSLTKKHKKSKTPTTLPNILLSDMFSNVDTNLAHHCRDELSSKSSNKSKRKSKAWTKFQETLRRNLFNEFQRLIEVGEISEQILRDQSTDSRRSISSWKSSRKKEVQSEIDDH